MSVYGGNRLDAGAKKGFTVKEPKHPRTNGDLSHHWQSSMGTGTLVPVFCLPLLRDESCRVRVHTAIRTKPSMGQSYAVFVHHTHGFEADMRLYQRVLHNNRAISTETLRPIGLDVSEVRLPLIRVTGANPGLGVSQPNQKQISSSSLLGYLGIRGLGRDSNAPETATITVDKLAIPVHMMMDIYKNYYANLQEKVGYQVGTRIIQTEEPATPGVPVTYNSRRRDNENILYTAPFTVLDTDEFGVKYKIALAGGSDLTQVYYDQIIEIIGTDLNPTWFSMNARLGATGTLIGQPLTEWVEDGVIEIIENSPTRIRFISTASPTSPLYLTGEWRVDSISSAAAQKAERYLIEFPLTAIDEMREELLGAPTTEHHVITKNSPAPYGTLVAPIGTTASNESGVTNAGDTISTYALGGLMVKTYQNNRFNTWMAQDWVESVNARTALDVSAGILDLGRLNLAEATWEMLNDILASGGTMDDWGRIIYGGNFNRYTEKPQFRGGTKTIISFNDIAQTANTAEGTLGEIGGVGGSSKQKGGAMYFKSTDQGSFIMLIDSITPLVSYSQGNAWWTRITTMDDWHKPHLDAIAFQKQVTDDAVAWDTQVISDSGAPGTVAAMPVYGVMGYQPPYLEYITFEDTVYGEFANANEQQFQVITRNYEPDLETGRIRDLTTYIDPSKHNHMFADASINAQNFWVEHYFEVSVSRKMKARQMPNIR